MEVFVNVSILLWSSVKVIYLATLEPTPISKLLHIQVWVHYEQCQFKKKAMSSPLKSHMIIAIDVNHLPRVFVCIMYYSQCHIALCIVDNLLRTRMGFFNHNIPFYGDKYNLTAKPCKSLSSISH